jgi:hypothetical protein
MLTSIFLVSPSHFPSFFTYFVNFLKYDTFLGISRKTNFDLHDKH